MFVSARVSVCSHMCLKIGWASVLSHIYKPIIISLLISLCSEEISFLLCRFVCVWVPVADFLYRSVSFTFHLNEPSARNFLCIRVCSGPFLGWRPTVCGGDIIHNKKWPRGIENYSVLLQNVCSRTHLVHLETCFLYTINNVKKTTGEKGTVLLLTVVSKSLLYFLPFSPHPHSSLFYNHPTTQFLKMFTFHCCNLFMSKPRSIC